MKKALLSIILLLFTAITVTAQVSAKENERAKAYIKQAKEYASKKELDRLQSTFRKHMILIL